MTADVTRLLQIRRAAKAKKPTFLREDYDKKSLGKKWRHPTGRHSKIKHQFKGNRKMPSPGYRAPLLIRGLTRAGQIPIVIHTISELENLDAAKHIVVLGHDVGGRKRLQLLKKIHEKNLLVHNVKDVSATINKLEMHGKKTAPANPPTPDTKPSTTFSKNQTDISELKNTEPQTQKLKSLKKNTQQTKSTKPLHSPPIKPANGESA